MSKKKKEVCPYCGQEFLYLSRHKCKVRQRIESEDDDTEQERQQARFDFRIKELSRKLKKDEISLLDLIRKEKELSLDDLKEKANIASDKLESILDVLELKSKIKIQRELTSASWTKYIFYIEEIEESISKKQDKVDIKKADFIWNLVWRVPCFLCPYINRCDINQENFNPNVCVWFTDWVWYSLDKKMYQNPFEQVDEGFFEE
jgi:hypothetical protein